MTMHPMSLRDELMSLWHIDMLFPAICAAMFVAYVWLRYLYNRRG